MDRLRDAGRSTARTATLYHHYPAACASPFACRGVMPFPATRCAHATAPRLRAAQPPDTSPSHLVPPAAAVEHSRTNHTARTVADGRAKKVTLPHHYIALLLHAFIAARHTVWSRVTCRRWLADINCMYWQLAPFAAARRFHTTAALPHSAFPTDGQRAGTTDNTRQNVDRVVWPLGSTICALSPTPSSPVLPHPIPHYLPLPTHTYHTLPPPHHTYRYHAPPPPPRVGICR